MSVTSRNATLVAAGIFVSRVSGFVRTRAMTHFLGTSFAADAFNAALRIPNVLQNLLGEGVLSASFIPTYSRLLADGREQEAGRVAGAVAGLLTALTGVLVLVGVLLAQPITALIAPGLSAERFALTVTLVRIVTPGVGFLVLSAWALGVLNSHRRFFLSYVAPVLWNGAQIAALVALGAVLLPGDLARDETLRRLAVGLAWGTLAGGVLQLAVQLPTVLRLAHGLRPSLDTTLPGVRSTLRAFGPVLLGRGVVQLSAYVDTVLASFLVAGALATLAVAQTLYVLPISVFGMSVAAAALPEFAAERGDTPTLRRGIDEGGSRIAFFVVPTVVAYVVIGDLLVGALFQTGRFDRADTVAVWLILAAYALGLLATTTSRLLQSALYGLSDTATPARISALRVAVSALLGLALMFPLDRVAVQPGGLALVGELGWGPLPAALREARGLPPRLGPVGLALAAATGAWVEYGLLRRATRQAVGAGRLGGGRLRLLGSAAAGAGVTALLARLVVADLHPLLAGPLAAAAFGAAYLALAARLGVPEAQRLLRRRR